MQFVVALAFLSLAVALPLAGAYLTGKPIDGHLQFPPAVTPVGANAFSWAVFVPLATAVFAVFGWIAWRVARASSGRLNRKTVSFPWWGWVGVVVTIGAWVLAWNRLDWFAPWQTLTFTPLWVGYIVVINALTLRRTGHCMLRDRPAWLISLLIASVPFWWYFEYLNSYVGNWRYSGSSELSRWEYFLQASLPFATVLPAVLGTRDWLASFPRIQAAFTGLPPIRLRYPSTAAVVWLVIASCSLFALGIWPQFLYPLVWVAPVVVLASLQGLAGRPNLFSELKTGDWRALAIPALAALVCGVLWEMWNFYSLTRWEYSVPLVDRFSLFEMPLLGYAGYLPFGLACAAVGDVVFQMRGKP